MASEVLSEQLPRNSCICVAGEATLGIAREPRWTETRASVQRAYPNPDGKLMAVRSKNPLKTGKERHCCIRFRMNLLFHYIPTLPYKSRQNRERGMSFSKISEDYLHHRPSL